MSALFAETIIDKGMAMDLKSFVSEIIIHTE